ncbi:unnamed protein product [Peniophora sp. CBMAI 1063]|nr:unnamed protein product [Peniophora sp. CBMAI 1063]
MAAPQPQQVNIADLSLQQLGEVRKQLDDELQHLTSSFAQLKQVQAKFRSCIESCKELKPQNAGKTVLVPLTNSLYVPGKMKDPETVIIDIGTGYYVSKTRTEAIKHYEGKIDYLRGNLEALQAAIERKQDNLASVSNILQAKLQAEAASAKGSKDKD